MSDEYHWQSYDGVQSGLQYLCKQREYEFVGYVVPYVRKRSTFWFAKAFDESNDGMRGFKSEEAAKAYLLAVARML